jgi:DNA-directed RNA polymerase sigma subunit (sigma70/sigma32)
VRKLIKKSLMRMMSSIEETEEMEKIYSKIGESNIFNLTMSLNSVDYMSSMIIKLHYGLLGGKSIPIRKISSILGLSREKVTKLEKKGLLFLCDQVLTNSNSK